MSQSKTVMIGCRVSGDFLAEIDSAAAGAGMNRSEFLETAIARQLGKRPKLPLVARVAQLEKMVSKLQRLVLDS
ncbi:MAG: hypothetical protein WA885_03580 [Phormidesmis sp.]